MLWVDFYEKRLHTLLKLWVESPNFSPSFSQQIGQVVPTLPLNTGGWHMIKMLESFHDLRSKHFRTFNFVRSRDALSHLDDTLCFVKVSMRQQQQNQNRKKQPANLPKTVSRIRFNFFQELLNQWWSWITPSKRVKDLMLWL